MKNFILTMIVIALFISVVALAVSFGYDNQEQAYCECLGHQPYINTKWTGDDCLTLVLDIDNYYDGEALVEYLYSSMEYCR